MGRNKKSDIDFSPECMEAFDRLVTLAHQVSAMLTGDALSPEGKAQTPRSVALTMACSISCFAPTRRICARCSSRRSR